MAAATSPSVLVLYPSCFYYPDWIAKPDVRASQLTLSSYLAQYFPVTYADFEHSIGRPNSPTLIKRYERKVRDFFAKQDCDILAISCWTSLSYLATMKTARIFREMYPNKLIVVGGYHPSARPNEFLTEERLFDYVICGEGELILREIAGNLKRDGRPSETKIVHAPMFGVEHFVPLNLDLLEQHLAEHKPEGVQSFYMYLSRGCPFNCAFCMEGLKDRRWRAYSPEDSIKHILDAYKRFNFYSVAISDACFGMRPAWRKEFLRRLVDLQPEFWIVVETRPEYIDPEDIALFSKLKVEIELGVESGSPDILRYMKKTKQPEKYLEIVKTVSHRLSDAGVLHRANMIFNYPGETHRTLDETFAFMDAELQRKETTFMWAGLGYMHYPGCEMDYNSAWFEQQFGSKILCPDWWKLEEDQYTNCRRNIPSHDLANDPDLWFEMLTQRDQAMRNTLSPGALRFAANKYFPDWQNDPRYRQS